jgi:formylglycine-generating enzyme required for sulfatase activity
VVRLLAKNPEERFQSAGEVADLLGRWKNPEDRFHSAGEVADLLGRCLSEQPHHGRVETPGDTVPLLPKPTSAAPEPLPRKCSKPEKPPSRGRRGLASAATILVLFTAIALTEATGITSICDTVLRLFATDGKLVVGNAPSGTPALKETKSATLPVTYTNSMGMEFVLVPRGKSWLGGGEGKPGDKEVEIKEDFYLGKYEVTQEEWQNVTGANPSHFSHAGAGKDKVKDIPEAELKRFPVETVSWDDAQVFLKLVNQRDRHAGWVYRLPTEVEWEYACRGGPMADRLDSAFDFYFDRPVAQLQPGQANFDQPGLNRTCKVGSYPPNKLGLHDMHGNVWEWCEDAEKKPDGGVVRPFRGGCYEWHWVCRATARMVHHQHVANYHRGLRLARVPAADGPVLQNGQAPPPANGFGRVALPIPAKGQLGAANPALPAGANWGEPPARWLQE